MDTLVQFTVNDTSPTILYSPFSDTFSTPNLSAGWNPYFTLSGFVPAPGDIGNGTSLHITSCNGASFVLQWHGTAIQLWGNATFASYSITLDGAPFTPAAPSAGVLATIEGLADAPHAVALTAVIPPVQHPPNSSMVVFEKAVITSSLAPANVSFSPQTINDNNIAFLGRWTFETAPSGASFHTSHTLGDRAVTNFSGTTFLLRGITSPQSGNYTVTVDDVTTSLFGRSSFTSYDSLLFFVSGLDSASVHSVEVVNRGGDLSLLVGGFNTFVPVSTMPPLQNSPLVTTNTSFSQGTIAAFVLAGILAFIILSGLLFFFLIYRPSTRRRRVLAESIRRKARDHEVGVLNIGPEISKTAELSSPVDLDQRDSVRNGFSRWKRGAVEGSPGERSLAIRFRHSDSLDEKLPSPLSEVPHDDLSEKPSSNSSTRRKARAKSKGKARQITGRSWSPGITLRLPLQRSRSHRQSTAQQLSPAIESLSYVSTFVAAEPSSPKNVAPPSYAVSIRDSNSHTNHNSNSNPSSHPSSTMPSVPRSVSPFPGDHDRSYPSQNEESTGTFLLRSGESNSGKGSNGHSSHKVKPPEVIPMRFLKRDDRGSAVEDNLDDQNVLGPVSLQQVIRSLSPRTTRHPYASQDSTDALPSPHETDLREEDNAVSMPLPQAPLDNDELVEVRDGVFLSVRTPSPFQLNFETKQIERRTSDASNSARLGFLTASSRSGRMSDMSNVFEPPNPDGTRPPPVLMPTNPDFVQGTSSARFRLTPLSIPPTSTIIPPTNSSNGDSEGVTSFLDFTSSREGSLASPSVKTTSSEERPRGNLSPPAVEGKSRWSNTTVPSIKSKSFNDGSNNNVGNDASRNSASGNGSSGGSRKVSPSEPHSRPSTCSMPVQLSIPPSAYHVMGSNRRSRISGLTQTGENLHVHPTLESLESPTESIPMSVSDLHFRQSVSEESPEASSRRTTESSLVFASSHPPLPTQHDDFTPRPFDPTILVNRVLGLPSPTSTMTARPTGYSSSTSVTVTSSPSPFALRHDTRGDRSNPENSGTD